jgi:crossover junction endodeoxyribonuclease RuvC
MGYGIIEIINNKIELKEMNVLKLSSKKDGYERLQIIHNKVIQLIREYKPHEFAIEAPFFGKNVQSMLKLGRAQGVAIAAAMSASLPVTEYSPRKIKQSITGNGNADKERVWKMLQQILSINEVPQYFDATDALAVAVCHHFQFKWPLNATIRKKIKESVVKNGAWAKFIRENPQRLK